MASAHGGQAESVGSVARSEADEAAPLDTGLPGMPPSWVPRLQIGRDSLDMRCPRGVKSVLYHRCQHEIFALFGECSRWDGMVEKLTLYEVSTRSCAGARFDAWTVATLSGGVLQIDQIFLEPRDGE